MHRAAILVVVALLAGGCSSSIDSEAAPEPSIVTTSTTAPTTTTTTPTTTPSLSPLAERVVPLGSALFDPNAVAPPPVPPVSVTIEGIRVDDAPVIPVGVEENGEMAIPGAREVGWYRFGPTPRDEGSSVLAAHIAYSGRDGVFRRLASVDLGAVVTITYTDGTVTRHVVTEISQYGKDDLPLDRVFSKTGPATLTLITCGGDFNRSLNAYDDNVVVYAEPLAASD